MCENCSYEPCNSRHVYFSFSSEFNRLLCSLERKSSNLKLNTFPFYPSTLSLFLSLIWEQYKNKNIAKYNQTKQNKKSKKKKKIPHIHELCVPELQHLTASLSPAIKGGVGRAWTASWPDSSQLIQSLPIRLCSAVTCLYVLSSEFRAVSSMWHLGRFPAAVCVLSDARKLGATLASFISSD